MTGLSSTIHTAYFEQEDTSLLIKYIGFPIGGKGKKKLKI